MGQVDPVAEHELERVFAGGQLQRHLGLAAAEVAIFLSVILRLYRLRRDIDVEHLTELRG